MNDLTTVFNFENQQVRVIIKDDEPWFVAKDICQILELGDTHKAIERLDEDERNLIPVTDSIGRNQETWCTSESGLYSLVLGSRKPEAKTFKRWVTHEVIPTIRKHGAYMTPDTLEKMITSPEFGIKLLTALKEEQDKNKQLQALNSALSVENTIMAPKAEYFDELVERNLLTNFRETAKELSIKEKDFIKFLLDKKFIYRDKKGKLMPYAEKNNGLFEVKECFNEKTNWSGTQTLITPKGRETFRLLYLRAV